MTIQPNSIKLIANGFVADLPQGWEDRTVTTIVGPTDSSGFAANIVITKQAVPSKISIDAFAREQLNLLSSTCVGFQLLDACPTTVLHFPAFQQRHRFPADQRMLQQAQTFILCDAVVYIITCTATVEGFESYTHTFRQVVDSFQLFDPKAFRPVFLP